MKITHNKVGQNLNIREGSKTERADKLGGAAAASIKDVKTETLKTLGNTEAAAKVNLSSRAQDIKRAQELAKAAPEINEEKVARLQKLIDDGNYKVDAQEIAGKMIDEHASWE